MADRNPLEELGQLIERLSQEFEGTAIEIDQDWSVGFESMAIDLADRPDEFVVTADLPGFEKDDIRVLVTDSEVRIEASHETETTAEAEHYLRKERAERSESRSISLPAAVEADEVAAKYQNGVLTINVPKAEPMSEGHEVQVE